MSRIAGLLRSSAGGSRTVATHTPLAERTTYAGSAYRALRRYLRVAHGVVCLLAAARRRSPTELWFGDSHAIFLNQDYTSSKLSRAPEGQLVWHLGPRLMWSLGHNGFPRRARVVAALIRVVGRPGSIVPVFVAGEIDVRCHLVPRSVQPGYTLDFVHDYVRSCQRLARAMGAPTLVIATPVPPSDDCPRNPEFPIEGTIEERVRVFGEVRLALGKAVAEADGRPLVHLADATDVLADETGALRSELTDDGCHTNRAGVQVVRRTLRDLDLGPASR
jgi:lysophospholipase L1-like esterase